MTLSFGRRELAQRIGALKFTDRQKRALFRIVSDYGVDAGEWNRIETELGNDPTKIHGFDTDLTESWRERRRAAFRGTDEAREGLVLMVNGTAGSNKSGVSLVTACDDLEDKREEGLLARCGTPPEYRVFTPEFYIPDLVQYHREHYGKQFPPGFCPVFDDPRYLYDAENVYAFEGSVPWVFDQLTKGRRQNLSYFLNEVQRTSSVVPRDHLTHQGWMPRLRIPDVKAHLVLMARSSSDAFIGEGYKTVPAPLLYFGPEKNQMDAAEFMRQCNEKKDEAHKALFGKMKIPHQIKDLMRALNADPSDTIAHSINENMRNSFLARTLSRKWGYRPEGVAWAERAWWSAMKTRGYFSERLSGKGKKGAGTPVLTRYGRKVAMLGRIPGPAVCQRIVREWLDELGGPDAEDQLPDLTRGPPLAELVGKAVAPN